VRKSLSAVDVRLLVAGILLLAIAVRVAALGSHLSIDDAYSWYSASAPNRHVFLARMAENENTPPLVYVLIALLPGSSPAVLRLPAFLPGVALCLVTFLMLRRRVGTSAACLAALLVAVAPYLVTYSNLARGFMLADLALLAAVWAVVCLAEEETPAKWTAFAGAGVVAVWSEYSSIIVLAAIVATALVLGRPRRGPLVVAGALAVASLAPWLGQLSRAQDQNGLTKLNPLDASPSFRGLRDMAVSLAFGENGGTSSGVGRWLLLALILAAGAGLALLVRRGWARRDARSRYTVGLLAGTAAVTLVGHALVAVAGVDVFTQRYTTILIPLVAGLLAVAIADVPVRHVLPLVAAGLVVLGVGNTVRRVGGQYQPGPGPLRAATASLQPRTVLTNTPVVLYYLPHLHAAFDRPYNLGPGRTAGCLKPCLVIDDTRVHGGTPRPVTGAVSHVGPFLFTLLR
jgi:hypothetical protein